MSLRVISGSARGRKLKSVPGDTTRPVMDRVKEALFNILSGDVVDSNWWDLFRLPWEMMIDQNGRFGGNIGPCYVMCLPFLLFLPGLGFDCLLPCFVGWFACGLLC